MDVDDFIENGDPFDPRQLEQLENKAVERRDELTDNDQVYLRNQRAAYKEVFTPGETTQEALDFVLRDLAMFCRAYAPTFDLNPKLQDLKEGRREVYMRIMDHTVLTHEEQYRKYVNAQTGQRT